MSGRLAKIMVWMLDFKFSMNDVAPFIISIVLASLAAYGLNNFSKITLGNSFYAYILATILMFQLFFMWRCSVRSKGFFSLGYVGLFLSIFNSDIFPFVAVFVCMMITVKVVSDYYVQKSVKVGG